MNFQAVSNNAVHIYQGFNTGKLLIYNELTGNLDYKTSKDIFSILKLKKLKKTIIFATHNRELANIIDYKLFSCFLKVL